MRTINKKRAVLLTNINKTPETEVEEEERNIMEAISADCQYEVNGLANKLLLGTFSCAEEAECATCSHSPGPRRLPIISINQSLQHDFGDIVQAIEENFSEPICPNCQEPLQMKREFGNYVFLEVNSLSR